MSEGKNDLEQENTSPESVLDDYLSKTSEEIRPWETVQLPSKGVYYNNQVPDGTVEVRPFGLYADKAMTTQRLVKSGQALDQLFKKHVKLPNGFDHQDLLADDRVFLLYYLRGITHGDEYEFMLKCPECEELETYEYNLVELYETVVYPDHALGPEPFKLVLPEATKVMQKEHADVECWVKVRFLRGSDMLNILDANPPTPGGRARARNRKKKKNRQERVDEIRNRTDDVDETLERNINLIITEVMGSTNRSKIRQFVERMHSSDVSVVMDFLRDNSPGIDTMIEVNCRYPNCGALINCPLPITESFFRPKKSRGTGT